MTTSRLHSLDIRLLRAFAVVAEENNISRAAQRLFISQPPLTRHIRHLEAQLGVTLFQRHSKGLILTDAGKEVLEMIQPLLALQERTLAALSELAVHSPQALRLGVTTAFWFKRERNPGFFDYTRRIFDRAGYAPTYVEEPAEHDVLLARIARGEGMILLPASFSAIQRQGVAFCPVAEGDAMPLSLGVIYPPHQAESVQQWLSLLDGILATG